MAGCEMYDLERLSTSSIEGQGTFSHYIKPRKDKDETSDQKTKELATSIRRLKIACFVIVATVFLIAAAAGLYIYQLLSRLESMEDRVVVLRQDKESQSLVYLSALQDLYASTDNTAKTVENIETRLTALENNRTEDISNNFEHLNAELSVVKSERKGDLLVLQQHTDKLNEIDSDALHMDQMFKIYESRLTELENNRTEDISVFGHLDARLLVLESHKEKDLSVLQQQADKLIELESNADDMNETVEKYESLLADLKENIKEDISNFEKLNSRILDIDSNRRSDLTILHQLNSTFLKFQSDRLDNFAVLQELNATLTDVESVSQNHAEFLLQQENKLNQLEINQLRDEMILKEFNSSMSELQLQSSEDVLMFTRQFENLSKLETSQLEDHSKLQNYERMFTRSHALIQQLNNSIADLEADRNANEELFQLFNSTLTNLESDRKEETDFLKQLNSRLTDAESRVESREGKSMVGFTAKGIQTQSNGVLIYNKVLSEVGGGFNNKTGGFTCPVAGLYLVSIMLEAEKDGHVNRYLFKEGLHTSIGIEINDANNQELASQTAVLNLNKGESLYIGSYGEDSSVVDETTFTVVLIQADT